MARKGPSPKATVPAAESVAPKSDAAIPVARKVSEKAAGTAGPNVAVKPSPVPPAVPVPLNPAAAAAEPEPIIAPQQPEIVPVVSAAATIEKEIDTMEATIRAAAEKAQTEAKTIFADANTRAKTAMEKGSKMVEDLNEFSKGNVEAIVESSKIAAKGAEEVAKYTTDYVKATVEKANVAAKSFAAVKSPTELFKLQSEYAKDAMDSVMAETAKFTEHYLKLLGEIAQPISNRVAVAAEKMKIAA